MKYLKEFWKFTIDSIKETDKNDVLVFLFLAFVLILSHAIGEPSFFRKRFNNSFEDKSVLRLCSVFYRQAMAFITGFLIPFLFFTLVIKKKPSSLGVSMGDKGRGFFCFFVSLVFMLPVLWIASKGAGYQRIYPPSQLLVSNWGLFSLYAFGELLYMTGWEYTWRGFSLFLLYPKHKLSAAFFLMIPFITLHFGKPLTETTGSLFAALILSLIAVYSRSFVYPVLIHTAVMISISLFSIIRR